MMKKRILIGFLLVLAIAAAFVIWQETHAGASVSVEESLSREAALEACPAVALSENDRAVMEAIVARKSVQQAMAESGAEELAIIGLDLSPYLPAGAEVCAVSTLDDDLYLSWQEQDGRQSTILSAVQTAQGMELTKTVGLYSGAYLEALDRYETCDAIYVNNNDETYTRYTEKHRFFAWLTPGAESKEEDTWK